MLSPKEIMIILSVSGFVASVIYLLLDVMRRAREIHEQASREVVVTDTSGLMRSLLPVAHSLGMGLRTAFGGYRKQSFYARLLEIIRRRLSTAGNPQGIDADEFMGFGLLWSLGGGAAGVLFYVFLEEHAMVSVYVWFGAFFLATALYWRAWLSGKKLERQFTIRKSLPFCLDLLTLSMEAGLDFTSALGRMVHKIGGNPLGQEFSLLLREIQLGKTRAEALRDFANRVDVAEVRSVVASLIQADELGAPLGPILRIQAAQQRERRSQRAEEMAMKAPVKMLFPLVVFIFPVTLILIGGVLVLNFL